MDIHVFQQLVHNKFVVCGRCRGVNEGKRVISCHDFHMKDLERMVQWLEDGPLQGTWFMFKPIIIHHVDGPSIFDILVILNSVCIFASLSFFHALMLPFYAVMSFFFNLTVCCLVILSRRGNWIKMNETEGFPAAVQKHANYCFHWHIKY